MAEIKKRITGDIRELNERLLDESNGLAIKLGRHELAGMPQGKIIIALFKKAVNTFRAIQILKSEKLIEESWILLRVLLESYVNLLYFLKSDPTEATRRMNDTAMLDKLKYLKEVNFYEGTALAHMGKRNDWERAEREITARYSKNELHAMKKFGYSGISVQQRAEFVGLRTMYQDCYRIASRSVHTFDPAETGLMDYLNDAATQNELLSARRETLDSTQNLLLGRLAFLMSEMIKEPLISMRLFLLGIGYEKYRDKRDGRVGTETMPDPDTLYAWRE
jgi:Family of unknown function (DUF5677)